MRLIAQQARGSASLLLSPAELRKNVGSSVVIALKGRIDFAYVCDRYLPCGIGNIDLGQSSPCSPRVSIRRIREYAVSVVKCALNQVLPGVSFGEASRKPIVRDIGWIIGRSVVTIDR